MKKGLVFAWIAMAAGFAMAQIDWMGNSYMIIEGIAGNWDWYSVSAVPDASNPALPASLEVNEGDKIGFQTQFHPITNGYGAEVVYTVNGGESQTINLSWFSNSGGSSWDNAVYWSDSNEEFIPVTAEMDNVVLEFFFATVDDSTGEQVQWDNNGGQNYSVTLNPTPSAVPEPAAMTLLGLGALAMVLRRKLRQ
ncbi:MAG: PEP-CTERM sorting domain-containing protein [Verrucomicrobiota bacterium]|nr:PEP-CTERM sorting domain-containing protein [Verrucomicrobiota bacterium]